MAFANCDVFYRSPPTVFVLDARVFGARFVNSLMLQMSSKQVIINETRVDAYSVLFH